MQLPPLVNGTILRRYKRFLADVELEDGEVITAHCPNTGSMTGCWAPGAPVQLSLSDNPARKLTHTLERVDMGAGWVGVHTGRTNPVIAEAIEQGRMPALAGYRNLTREVTVDLQGLPRSRLDIVLRDGSDRPDAYIEVKNTTLLEGSHVCFPDAVTERGRKHLELLLALVQAGHRGIIVFAVNRPEGTSFRPAAAIDPKYADTLSKVIAAGVEAVAARIHHGAGHMEVRGDLPVEL